MSMCYIFIPESNSAEKLWVRGQIPSLTMFYMLMETAVRQHHVRQEGISKLPSQCDAKTEWSYSRK